MVDKLYFGKNFEILSKRINLNKNYINNIYFGNSIETDKIDLSFSTEKFYNKEFIQKQIEQNPELQKILKDHNIETKFNMNELNDLRINHCKIVCDNAIKIYKNLPPTLKKDVNVNDLKMSAILHDFGKVLIPKEILNKKGKLNAEEQKIMNLHSELGYQILKNTGINNNVLNLIRYHHKNIDDNKNFVPDINLQILNLADKYSALTENRIYRLAYSPQKALEILNKEKEEGKIHPFLYNTLLKIT